MRLHDSRLGANRIADAAILVADPDAHLGGFARLKLTQALRFARWGKPVEAQVRDHPGVTRAAVAYRPLNTFSTFSIWRSEHDMLGMVRGRQAEIDGTGHRDAMRERVRQDFHASLQMVPSKLWPSPTPPMDHVYDTQTMATARLRLRTHRPSERPNPAGWCRRDRP